jgi:transposase-like protein
MPTTLLIGTVHLRNSFSSKTPISIVIKRNSRTPSSEYIGYGLYLYFSGLSSRRASTTMLSCFIRRNHETIWNRIQKYNPQKIKSKRKKGSEYIVDETLLKVAVNIYGYGLQLNLKTNRFSHYVYQKRETCL